jgi:hypothetical protein
MDAESVAGHLVEPGSVFALLPGHRRVLFAAGMFADLFPPGGRRRGGGGGRAVFGARPRRPG